MIVVGVLAALAIVSGVVSLVSDEGGPRTVTTVVLDTTGSAVTAPPPTSPSGFPLGAVLPPAIDGWALVATDPAVVNVELENLGAVETAQATHGGETGLLVGLRPDRDDGRVAVERLRDEIGGVSQGLVPLGGLASQGIAQGDGSATTVTFASADRVVLAVAGSRAEAASLAAAASEALGP